MDRIDAIRTGGQTGADRGAMDAARAAGVPLGGFVPKGGYAEDFQAPPGIRIAYPEMTECFEEDPAIRTTMNVEVSGATLVIGDTDTSPGTQLTVEHARKMGRDVIIAEGKTVAEIAYELQGIPGVYLELNVAGPRESEQPGVYEKSFELVRALIEYVNGR